MEERSQSDAVQVASTTGKLRSAVQPVPQIEKFSVAELTSLRTELLQSHVDSWQAADIAASFLAGHGYGASADHLRELIAGIELSRCTIDCLQAQLERVAYIQ
jgi:hypothetical protein